MDAFFGLLRENLNDVLFALLPALCMVLVHWVLSVVVHEGGHLVFGLATGYKFLSFNVLSVVFTRPEGRLKISRNKDARIAGQCLMAPPKSEAGLRYGLYNVGGGLANIAAAALLGPCALLINRAEAPYLFLFCFTGAALHLSMGILSLVPLSANLPNDGRNLLTASKSPLARRGMWMMLRVNQEMSAGKRLRDYPAGAFLPPGSAPRSENYLECYLMMLEAGRLLDLNRPDEAAAMYDGLDLNRLNPNYAAAIMADLLYHYTVYAPDYGRARALYAEKRLQRLLKAGLPGALRPLAAYLWFVAGQKQRARALLEKARAQMHGYPVEGLAAMELDALDELEEMMDAAEQNSLDGAEGPDAGFGP